MPDQSSYKPQSALPPSLVDFQGEVSSLSHRSHWLCHVLMAPLPSYVPCYCLSVAVVTHAHLIVAAAALLMHAHVVASSASLSPSH